MPLSKNFTVLLVLCLISATMAQGPWTEKAHMPTPRTVAAAAVFDGKIYVLGGFSTLKTVEVYDPATNKWDTSKAPMPTGKDHFTAGVVDGIIYAISEKTVEAYNPKTDTWESKNQMPTPRGGMMSAVVDGKIYVMGGTLGPDWIPFKTVEVYDPEKDS